MFTHRISVSSICLIWCLFHRGLTENVKATNARRPRSIFDSECVTDFKMEKIDSDDKEIKFSWKVPKGLFPSSSYSLMCYSMRSTWNMYKEFSCSSSDYSSFQKQKDKWSYYNSNTKYYCAVFSAFKRSNILEVTTPPLQTIYPTATSLAFGMLIFIIIISVAAFSLIFIGIYCCCRRRTPGGGIVVRSAAVVAPPVGTQNYVGAPVNGQTYQYAYNVGQVQQPLSYPIQEQMQATAPSQPCVQPNPWENPPPYTEKNEYRSPAFNTSY